MKTKMTDNEKKELQILSQKGRLTYGECLRENILWNKYFNEDDRK